MKFSIWISSLLHFKRFSEKRTAIDHFGQLLTRAGFNYYGNETMYSGVDGREMEVSFYM